MKLLLQTYHVKKAERRIGPSRQTSHHDPMLQMPVEFNRDIDMEAICCDLPMLEPLSDDDVIFGEYDDYDSASSEEQMRYAYIQRRQSYQFGSPSPEHVAYNTMRTSPTRASIQFGKDFGVGLDGYGRHDGHGTPLATMQEDEEESLYTNTETDSPRSDTSEDRHSVMGGRLENEVHHALRPHFPHDRASYFKRRDTMGTIDAESLRWSSHRDQDAKQYVLDSIVEQRVKSQRKHPAMLRRTATQPNLYATNRKPAFANYASLPSSPSETSRSAFQFPPKMGRKGSMAPTTTARAGIFQSAQVSPRAGLIGSPMCARRGSAAAAVAAAAAVTSHQPRFTRRATDVA